MVEEANAVASSPLLATSAPLSLFVAVVVDVDEEDD